MPTLSFETPLVTHYEHEEDGEHSVTAHFFSRSLSVHHDRRTGGKKRLHYLDWFRCLMVFAVVYAHTIMMGLEGGVQQDWQGVDIDDRSWNSDDPASFGVRWISIIRPWCLPMLFWVSGASMACSFKGKLKGVEKLILFTFVGIAANAALWYLGPLDKGCAPTMQNQGWCKGKGILFDFTVCPFAGREFAILFQMWYTLALTVMSVLNFPLFAVIHGSWDIMTLIAQWASSVFLYAFLVYHATNCEDPYFTLALLAGCEAIFLVLAPRAASLEEKWGPVPTRFLQYGLAILVVTQFAAAPFTTRVYSISTEFILYIFVGFNKFFALGFIMIHADAAPALQRLWPVVVVGLCFIVPSTNFVLAGNLTYPYFPKALDRILYVSFALVVLFSIQRHGHDMQCIAVPHVLNYAALVLYLFHPVFMTICIKMGYLQVVPIWLISSAASVLLVLLVQTAAGLFRKKKN